MRYTKSLVSFVDVLGFSSLVAEGGCSPERVGRILQLLRRGLDFNDDVENQNFERKFVNFSDTCIRSIPLTPSHGRRNDWGILFHEALEFVHVQLELGAYERVFLRGGITMGDVCHEDGLAFGPALVRAHALESHAARYPRIVLDPIVVGEFIRGNSLHSDTNTAEEETEFLLDLLAHDSDGAYFVDYLWAAKDECDEWDNYFKLLKEHQTAIKDGLHAAQKDVSLAVKFGWLARYHERTLDRLEKEEGIDASGFRLNETSHSFFQTIPERTVEPPPRRRLPISTE